MTGSTLCLYSQHKHERDVLLQHPHSCKTQAGRRNSQLHCSQWNPHCVRDSQSCCWPENIIQHMTVFCTCRTSVFSTSMPLAHGSDSLRRWISEAGVWDQVECAGEESANSNLVFPSPGVLFRGDFRRKRIDSVKSREIEGGGDGKSGAGSLN